MDVDYAHDIALQPNTLAQDEFLLHNLGRAAAGMGLHVKADKTEYMVFNQRGDISTLNRSSPKLLDKYTFLGSSDSSTETWTRDQQRLWQLTAIDKLWVIWKSVLTDKKKTLIFFTVALVSILLYGCSTGTLINRMEKKLDSNYTRMLPAILNKSWRQQPTKQQLYGYLSPITKTIQVRRTKHAGHCWRSRNELISDILL